MRQILDHIYRAQMAHSCWNMDKLCEELEVAAKIAEEKILQSATPTYPEAKRHPAQIDILKPCPFCCKEWNKRADTKD